MPRLRILLAVAALVLAIMHSSAAAQGGATRSEEGSYLGPTRQNTFGTRDCLTLGFFTQGIAPMSQGCVYFVVEPPDRFVSASIDDETGEPTAGLIWQYDADGNQLRPSPSAFFCTKTKKPVRLLSGAAGIIVAALEEDCQDGRASHAVAGTIRVSFRTTR